MAKMRERYFKGYVKEMVPTGKPGKFRATYVYHGNYYYWREGVAHIRKLKLLYPALLLLDLALYFPTALADWESNRAVPLMAAVLASLIPLFYEAEGLIRFCAAGEKLREFVFDEINQRLRFAPLIRGICLLSGAAVALVWCFFAEEPKPYLLSALTLAVSGACGLAISLLHRKLRSVLVEEGDYGDIEDQSDWNKQMKAMERELRKLRDEDGKPRRG